VTRRREATRDADAGQAGTDHGDRE
jgi:hypothetical protein